MKIAIGCDEAGYALEEILKSFMHSFLAARFSGGPSAAKIERIAACESGET